ncbi:bifunctional folylpolyglutamate synthase/dihydrofolate synthase [Bacillus sp. Bva_UNVM-123]|uniref:bifunctional folylpolyglutamate synthase/dihydrofolate synthase n=1 Tax=Bacillus sp. Bva_UNVM-123 TaxID=2829798 RepID=UPI00391F710B
MDRNYVEALQWIHSRKQFGIRPGLFRMEYLLEKLGNPQHELKVIHIGGTNGKGSTVTYVKELLQNSGLVVGTFTSPFIESFNEEISINGHHISNDDLVYLVNKIKPIVLEMDRHEDVNGVTEFEVITAMMFTYFYEQKVDVAVIEVGLGGLLDSTNVVKPVVCGITTIGLDHLQILGDTIEKIAEQKAGIIKENCSVVTGNIGERALNVIVQKARSVGATIYRFNEDYTVHHILSEHLSREYFSFTNKEQQFPILYTTLLGKHQVENAGMALQIYFTFMEKCQFDVNREIICESLNNAFIPGRMEILSERPYIITDGAHNIHAMKRLQNNIQEMLAKTDKGKLYILFSAINTKDVSGMLHLIEEIQYEEFIITLFDHNLALTIEDYEKCGYSHVAINWEEAITSILNKMDKEDFFVITGSLYFISTMRTKLKELCNSIVSF